MDIVGYKTIEEGDHIYYSTGQNHGLYYYTITNGHELLGRTAWLMKNSWGNSWRMDGYFYLCVDIGQMMELLSPVGTIASEVHSDSDIVCEDSDGDGYYYWGIGSKPSFCPEWIPDTPDGDESDITKGAVNQYGYLESLQPDSIATYVVNGNETFNNRQSLYSHIRIPSNAKLTVSEILNLFGNVTVTIESGGQLVIDGGVVTNADIAFSPGGKLVIKNGGKLVIRTGTVFNAPTGALVDISEGDIIRSHDF